MPGQSDDLERLLMLRELRSLGIAEADAQRLLDERDAARPKAPTFADLARDVTRRLGLGGRADRHGETFPKSDLTVDVTAPAPPHTMYNDPGSGDMARIALGSLRERPTGTYVPQSDRVIGPAGTNLSPRANAIWDKVRAAHPYVSRSVDAVRMEPDMPPDVIADFATYGPRELRINPHRLDEMSDNEIRAALMHELTHAGQRNNFQTFWDHIRNYIGFDFGNTESWPARPYRQQLGEAQGYDVGADAEAAPRRPAKKPVKR